MICKIYLDNVLVATTTFAPTAEGQTATLSSSCGSVALECSWYYTNASGVRAGTWYRAVDSTATAAAGYSFSHWRFIQQGTNPDDFESTYNPYIVGDYFATDYERYSNNVLSSWQTETREAYFTTNPTPVSYTLTYNANGGNNAPAAQTFTSGVAFNISNSRPTRAGYEFAGWADSSSGGIAYLPGALVTFTANKTIYAVWGANSHLILYSPTTGQLLRAKSSPYNLLRDD